MTTPTNPWPDLTSDPAVDPLLVDWLQRVARVAPPRGTHEIQLFGIPRAADTAPEFLGSAGDVYRLLRRTTPPAGFVGLGVVAMAWIGQLDNPLPPSRQPGRRRCRNIVVIDEDDRMASRLEIESDDPVILGPAEGRVSIALRSCWRRRLDAA